MTTPLEVRRATTAEVLGLRKAVLRPGEPVVPSDYDGLPTTIHIGAFADREVVGCASFFPEPYEGEPLAWRLRGMAVADTRRGEGIGRLVLEAGVEAAREAGARFFWATGRVSAMGFYELLGWAAVGPDFPYGPAALAHRLIVLRLASSPRCRRPAVQ